MTPDAPAAPVKGVRRWVGRKCAATAALSLVLLLTGGFWAFGVAQHGLAAARALQRIQGAATGGSALSLAGSLPTVRTDLAIAAAELREVQSAAGWLRPVLGA
ncbi:MAG: hypothetical protein NTZ05_18140, partial [Chloroflexi bacterium]|nr:hypothetical protein [Chloroflexota bacterium]